jgi:hypothetical protein
VVHLEALLHGRTDTGRRQRSRVPQMTVGLGIGHSGSYRWVWSFAHRRDEGCQTGAIKWSADQIALDRVAASRDREVELRRRLDAFDRRRHAKALGHRDDGSDDCRALCIMGHLPHE